ncbi:MAG TPA: efflux RND transporter periplasmic adaptor subunit [Bryobacteraceae bacterium]|nr:efflux RND transporter periplasmic adaptor subunit [Bryobacteraceae bacterium]
MIAQEPGVKPAQRVRPGRGPVVAFFLLLAVIVAGAVVGGLLPRLSRQKVLLAASQQEQERTPVVIASPAHFASSQGSIDLPGDLTAQIESPIFARADGYLKTRYSELGDHVKAGQVMAELETPELDQQISQAHATVSQVQSTLKELQADLDLARANRDLAKVTRDRWQSLLQKGVVSRQEGDEKQADLSVKEAQVARAEATLSTAQDTIHAAQANLARLEQMKSFARVTAPFDGLVTARLVDVGVLINAGNGGSSKEMFRVAQITPMRIFVNVPQTYVALIHAGQDGELRVEERPGQVFPARVKSISTSLDTASRAMLAILVTPNADGSLYPGMYAQVRFTGAGVRSNLRIPGDAVILGTAGPRVATVGSDHVVHLRNITIGQDLGNEVEVTSGLAAGTMVISNPTDAVQENAVVEVRNK